MKKEEFIKYGNDVHNALKEIRRITKSSKVVQSTITVAEKGTLFLDVMDESEHYVAQGILDDDGFKMTIKDTVYIK